MSKQNTNASKSNVATAPKGKPAIGETNVIEDAIVDGSQELTGTAELQHAVQDLRYVPLDQLDFDPKWNVRHVKNYVSAVARKKAELVSDGILRNPLGAAIMVGHPSTYLRGFIGFLRYHALVDLSVTSPEWFQERFPNGVPVLVVGPIDEVERHKRVLDHGSEVPLTEQEIVNEWMSLKRQGYSRPEACQLMSKMFVTLLSVPEREEFSARVEILTKTGKVPYGPAGKEQELTTLKSLCEKTFTGRYQYYERLLMNPVSRDYFLRFLDGDKDTHRPTYVQAQNVVGKNEEETLAILDQKRGKSGTTEESGKVVKMKSKTNIEDMMKMSSSEFYRTQLAAILGDPEKGNMVPEMEANLVRIERAMNQNPTEFWALVDRLNAEYNAAHKGEDASAPAKA